MDGRIFSKNNDKKFWHGVFIRDVLVSVAGVPEMPFMSNEVQEPSIDTLPEYQGKGYAKMACTAMIRELIDNDVCPLWMTSAGNTASIRLAASLGFKKFSEELIIAGEE